MSLERLEPQEKSLDWMYEGPSALVNREDYLLGRKVDKSFQLLEAAEKGGSAWLSEAEKDLTPLSILKPSGITGAIDVVRKIKNDPLYQIQKKEQEYRKQILQNPILLKKIQQQHGIVSTEDSPKKSKHEKKSKYKKHKKKHRTASSSDSSSSSDEEVNQLLKTLKHSVKPSKDDNPSQPSSSKSDKKPKYKERRKRHDSESESDAEVKSRTHDVKHKHKTSPPYRRRSRTRSRSPQTSRRHADSNARNYRDREGERRAPDSRSHYDHSSRSYTKPTPRSNNRYTDQRDREPPAGRSDTGTKKKLNEEEMERRRQEMMGNAKQRDEERQKVVEKHREELRKEHDELEKQRLTDKNATFINKQLADAANTGSVEQRVKSNAYNIQRSKFAMDSNFARR